jgi:hypothetical protein
MAARNIDEYGRKMNDWVKSVLSIYDAVANDGGADVTEHALNRIELIEQNLIGLSNEAVDSAHWTMNPAAFSNEYFSTLSMVKEQYDYIHRLANERREQEKAVSL